MNPKTTLRQAILDCAQSPVRSLDEGYQWALRFEEGFMGFSGHFPGHPVLPAFIQILVTQCAFQLRTGYPWTLQRIKRAKFMKTVTPNQTITVTWQEKDVPEGRQGSFALWVRDAKVASFIAVYAPEEAADA